MMERNHALVLAVALDMEIDIPLEKKDSVRMK